MIHWTRWISRILQNASKRNWIHTLLKCTWNFLQNRPHTGSKIRSQSLPKIGIVPCIFSDHNALKQELTHKKKFGRNSNTWRLRTILLKDERVNQEIRKELKTFTETNEDTTIQNLWDTAKAVLRGKYIAIQASIQKLERTQIQKLTLH